MTPVKNKIRPTALAASATNQSGFFYISAAIAHTATAIWKSVTEIAK